jgi:hypothetical protein
VIYPGKGERTSRFALGILDERLGQVANECFDIKVVLTQKRFRVSDSACNQTVNRERLTSRFLICFASGESAPMTLKLDFELVSLLSGFRGALEEPRIGTGGPLLAMVDLRTLPYYGGVSRRYKMFLSCRIQSPSLFQLHSRRM